MRRSNHFGPTTLLRQSYERARVLSIEDQMRECIDQLENPEIIAGEVLDAVEVMESCFDLNDLTAEIAEEGEPDPEWDEEAAAVDLEELSREFFYATREIIVIGERRSFTCLASDVHPLAGVDRADSDTRDGLDYVGLSCDADATPVLGAVQSDADASAYPLLLRSLACLTEMAPEAQIVRLNRQFFKGALRAAPTFDLNLVLFDGGEDEELTPIAQLTRDLAEKVKIILEASPRPGILRDVVCLLMNPERFDADSRLRFGWRV